jgi:V/A-type H+-transporting ATPase subunit E
MSLDTVVEDIRDEARARREEIIEAAEAEQEEIVAEAEAEAEETRSAAEAEAEREIERERDQRLSSAKLEAKQERLEARRDALDDARERVEERVAGIEGDRRRELTRALIAAAEPEFDEDVPVSIYGRAEDEELLSELLADYDGWSYAGERDCLGGIVAESRASRVRVNNTFDSVVDDVWEDNLREISDILFGERAAESAADGQGRA